MASMAIERTLILIKPDAVSRGLIGEITARIERRGYVISAMKLMQLDGESAREHYAEHQGKGFFDALVGFITSAPLVAIAVEGEGAIRVAASDRRNRSAQGGAWVDPGDLAQTIGRNLVHGSNSAASASASSNSSSRIKTSCRGVTISSAGSRKRRGALESMRGGGNPLIEGVHAREVLDSRGNPTIAVTVATSFGAVEEAMVPSGDRPAQTKR